jgi:hypothetical protein
MQTSITVPEPATHSHSREMAIFQSSRAFLAVILTSLPALPVVAQTVTTTADTMSGNATEEAHRTYLQLLRAEDEYPTAASCAQCHPGHYEEWSVSPHAYAMMSPVFNSMHTFLTQRTSGTNGDFCIRCHTPVGMEREEKMFGSALLRSPIVVEGVSCVVCHRVDRQFGNSSGRFALKRGDLTDSIMGPTGNANLQDAIANQDLGLVTRSSDMGKKVHGDAIRFPAISTSAACATCHDVNSPAGIRLESAFTEYKNSPASKAGISCQDCHMSQTPGAVVEASQRYDADGRDLNYAHAPAARIRSSPRDPREGTPTPPRKRTNHMFIGPDYSIVHPGLYPHSLEAREFTYGNRFRNAMMGFLADVARDNPPESENRVKQAASTARRHALSDWITFRWWEGWGTAAFEEGLSKSERESLLQGVGFPWHDEDDPVGSRMRRESARLILSRQFNLLNRAHAERTRILRRALQLKRFEVTKYGEAGIDFEVDVHNVTTGHAVPTGFDAERVMFLEVTVHDDAGRVVFRSGDRDPNGDLRDLHSSYVHAGAPKTGRWLDQSGWKVAAGLPLRKDDQKWVLDSSLFTLQSHFINRNLVGGEREEVLPVNVSMDPLPFVRPSTRAEIHTGRTGGSRKQFRTIPPLSHRTAKYQVDRNQLSGTPHHSVNLRLISQMVPVNLVKSISSVGFDYNLSPAEVARRTVHGHKVSNSNRIEDRRGGATVIWDVTLPLAARTGQLDLTPTEAMIAQVPVTSYPFPHTSEKELQARAAALSAEPGSADQLQLRGLENPLPKLWPGGVPDGLPFLPPLPKLPTEPLETTPDPAGP